MMPPGVPTLPWWARWIVGILCWVRDKRHQAGNMLGMASPYGRWETLTALLEAADVPAKDLDRHTTPELLRLAEARLQSAPRAGRAPRRPRDERPAYSIRSIRVLKSVEMAVDEKARAGGTTLNAVVCQLLQEYLDASS